MKKLFTHFPHISLLLLSISLLPVLTQCFSSSEGSTFPAKAWTDAGENVGQLVSGVSATMFGDKVHLTYDLAQDADVWVVPSFDNGMSYCGALQSVKGDVGQNISKGEGKSIVWNFKAEQDSMYSRYPFDIEDVRLKIFADLPVLHNTTPEIVWVGEEQHLLNAEGEVIIGQDRYSVIMVEGFSGNVPNFIPIPVKDKHGKWGMIDHMGTEVVPCRYQHLVRYNPFLYIAFEEDGCNKENGYNEDDQYNNEEYDNADRYHKEAVYNKCVEVDSDDTDNIKGKRKALILSNTGMVLGDVEDYDSLTIGNVGQDGIKTCQIDTFRYTYLRGFREPLKRNIFIGKTGEVYSGDLSIRSFKDLAYYPLKYTHYPNCNLVTEGSSRRDCQFLSFRGFESLDEIFEIDGHKVYFLEYMKDDTRGSYDYYIKKGHILHSYCLPKGISPYKKDGSDYTEYLASAGIVKAVDDQTGLLGVYDIEGREIIPCRWNEIIIHVNEESDGDDHFIQENFYLCRKADNTGIICVRTSQDEEVFDKYRIVAYTDNDCVAKFTDEVTQGKLRPGKNCWQLSKEQDNGDVITLKDAKPGTYALIDYSGRLIANNVESVLWIDFNTGTRLIGLVLKDNPSTTRYYDLKEGRFVDCLNGCVPYGYIPPFKYCMRQRGNTIVYDAELGKITQSVKGMVPINQYGDNRIILASMIGETCVADSTLSIKRRTDLPIAQAKRFSEGLCWAQDSDGSWLLMNDTGKVLTPITDCKKTFGQLYEFHNGLCRIAKNGKYGYVDRNGRIVIPCIYEDADDFDNGYAVVSDDGIHWGVIDCNGAVKRPCIYTSRALAKYQTL